MKLTMCNAHEFKLVKNGKFLRNKTYYFLKDECQYCKNPFMSFNYDSKYCTLKCSANSQKHSYEEIKKSFADENYTLLSTSYKSNKEYLKFKCDKGHVHKIKWNDWQQGTRCFFCSKNNGFDFNEVKKSFADENYILLSTSYSNRDQYLDFICDKGHVHKITYGRWIVGQRCAKCDAEKTSSKQEKELQDFIESLGYDIIRNDRTQILNPLTGKNLELDVWIPDKNKAIEYNGIYWHDRFDMVQKDRIKVDQCKQKGIDLLIINDNKWINNREMEQDIIIKFLDKNKIV
jgi:hypothetical protein